MTPFQWLTCPCVPAVIQLVIAMLSNIPGYGAYNIGVSIVVLIAHYQRAERNVLLLALVLIWIAIVIDITWLGLYFDDIHHGHDDTAKFGLAMIFVSLFIKFFWTDITLILEYRRRGGVLTLPDLLDPSTGTGNQPFGAGRRSDDDAMLPHGTHQTAPPPNLRGSTTQQPQNFAQPTNRQSSTGLGGQPTNQSGWQPSAAWQSSRQFDDQQKQPAYSTQMAEQQQQQQQQQQQSWRQSSVQDQPQQQSWRQSDVPQQQQTYSPHMSEQPQRQPSFTTKTSEHMQPAQPQQQFSPSHHFSPQTTPKQSQHLQVMSAYDTPPPAHVSSFQTVNLDSGAPNVAPADKPSEPYSSTQ